MKVQVKPYIISCIKNHLRSLFSYVPGSINSLYWESDSNGYIIPTIELMIIPTLGKQWLVVGGFFPPI